MLLLLCREASVARMLRSPLFWTLDVQRQDKFCFFLNEPTTQVCTTQDSLCWELTATPSCRRKPKSNNLERSENKVLNYAIFEDECKERFVDMFLAFRHKLHICRAVQFFPLHKKILNSCLQVHCWRDPFCARRSLYPTQLIWWNALKLRGWSSWSWGQCRAPASACRGAWERNRCRG